MAAIPLISGAFSGVGQLQSGEATSRSLFDQADNLDAQASEAEAKGRYDAMREQMISGSKIGTSIAAYGAAGVESNSGSVLDVIETSHRNAELDRLNILHGADIRAINYKNQASMNRYGGASALVGSYWSALGSFGGGAINSFGNSTAAAPKQNSSGNEDTALSGSGESGSAGPDNSGEAAGLA